MSDAHQPRADHFQSLRLTQRVGAPGALRCLEQRSKRAEGFRSLLLGLAGMAFCACRSLPPAIPGEVVVWPAGFQQRDHYLGPGVHVLATNAKDAARGIRRYEKMLSDLDTTSADLSGPGILLILGRKDALEDEELKRQWKELRIRSDHEIELESPEESWALHLETIEPASPKDTLLMIAMPLRVGEILNTLNWEPSLRPTWALSLATASAAEGALGRTMEIQMDEEGASLFQRALLPMAIGMMGDLTRKQVCTRALVEVAFSHLTKEERKALTTKL